MRRHLRVNTFYGKRPSAMFNEGCVSKSRKQIKGIRFRKEAKTAQVFLVVMT